MAFPDAYVAVDPSIILVANPSGTPPVPSDVELKCTSNKVTLTGEDTEADADAFCNPDGTIPGSTNWSGQIDVLLSYTAGADVGTWNLLHPLRKTKQTFKIKPKSSAIATSNPEATFQAWVPTIPFIDNTRGETLRFTLELDVVGEPVFATS